MELLSFIAFNGFSKPQTIKVLAKLAFKSMLLIFSYLCLQIQVTNYQWKLCVEIHSGTTINKYRDLSIYQTPQLSEEKYQKKYKVYVRDSLKFISCAGYMLHAVFCMSIQGSVINMLLAAS